MIFDASDKIQKWQYHVEFINLVIPGEEVISIPRERLVKMSLSEDYMNNYFPLFKVTFALESELYYKIQANKNDCRINIRIDKLYRSNVDSSQSLRHPFINDNYKLILDENTEDMEHSVKERQASTDYKNIEDSQKDDLSKIDNKFSFYLFKSDIIKGTRKNVNNIFSNVCITDVITALMTKAKISNVLMAPIDNDRVFEELLIPPLSVLKSLSYLDNYFGIYKRGTIIYFGLNYTYIIPFSGKCKAFRKNEKQNTVIVIPESTSTHTTELGMLDKKVNNTQYIIGDYRSIDISNSSISNNYINANEILVVDSYDGTISTSDSDAKNDSENFKKIYENRTENIFIDIIYASQSSSMSSVINVRLADYDLEAIEPNKHFQFIFEDSKLLKKYRDDYILAKAEHQFELEGEELVVSSVLSFCVDKKVQGE